MVDLCLLADEVFERVTGENAAMVGGFESAAFCESLGLSDPIGGDMRSSQGISFDIIHLVVIFVVGW